MVFQAGNHFVIQSHVGDKQKFQRCVASADKRQLFSFEGRPHIGLSFPKVGIDDVLYAFSGMFGQLTTDVYIIGHELRIKIHISIQACRNNHGEVFSAYIVHGCRGSSVGREIIEIRSCRARYIRMVMMLCDIIR